MNEVSQKQFDNEDEVHLPFDDQTITKEGTQKQFDPEESDNKE